MNRLTAFLGDSPLRVIVKLVILSLIVGAVLVSIGLTPMQLLGEIAGFFETLYRMGFDAFRRFADYILVGAVIVVPVFLLSRLLRRRGG